MSIKQIRQSSVLRHEDIFFHQLINIEVIECRPVVWFIRKLRLSISGM